MILDIDRSQRLKHRRRIGFAATCILRESDIQPQRKAKARMGRCTVYTIDGIPGEFIGQDALREKLFELGFEFKTNTLSHRLREGDGTVCGYRIRTVGFELNGKRVAA